MFTEGHNLKCPKQVQDIVSRLIQDYAPKQIILFGSYAHGNSDGESDIDLLVIKETSDRFIDRWVTVRRILSDPTRKIPLDVLVLTPEELANRLAIGDQFLSEIVKNGQMLYAA